MPWPYATGPTDRYMNPLRTLARHMAFFGGTLGDIFALYVASLHSDLSSKLHAPTEHRMRTTLIFFAVTAAITTFAFPLPLHDTNTQRLPDHPATTADYSEDAVVVNIQKHKAVPDIAAQILQLCSRSVR
jgi:hypothetical protein